MVQRPEELKFVRVPRLIFSLQGSTQNSMNWRPPNWTPTLPLAAVWPMPLLASCPPWRRPVHPPGQRLLDTHWHTHTQLCSWLFFFLCVSVVDRKPRKEENLSEEAEKVISALPDLSFMQAKVLMFPSTLTPLNCRDWHRPRPLLVPPTEQFFLQRARHTCRFYFQLFPFSPVKAKHLVLVGGAVLMPRPLISWQKVLQNHSVVNNQGLNVRGFFFSPGMILCVKGSYRKYKYTFVSIYKMETYLYIYDWSHTACWVSSF